MKMQLGHEVSVKDVPLPVSSPSFLPPLCLCLPPRVTCMSNLVCARQEASLRSGVLFAFEQRNSHHLPESC